MTPRRYQLRKEAVGIVAHGHPWIFRDQLSSAAGVFRDGDWLRLVDGANRVIGHGIYEAEGAIAIRVARTGPQPPDAAWWNLRLQAALARRGLGPLRGAASIFNLSSAALDQLARGDAGILEETSEDPGASLPSRTDGMRLVHGESDGLPAVVIDRFGTTLVAHSYARGADALARFAAGLLARQLDVPHVLVGAAHRRAGKGDPAPLRAVRGTPPAVARFTEDGVTFAVDLEGGQKTGAFLDLRGLRRAIATAPLTGARVLNLFAFSGMLGRAAELAGAVDIVQVDASERALAFAAAHHVVDPARHTFVTADVFAWLPAQAAERGYDVVIVDPPAMTSHMAQVPRVLAAYRKLYRAAAPHVRPGGLLVAACCTSRVLRAAWNETCARALGKDFVRERQLGPEPDHPIGFPQADYLKIAFWRKGG